MNMNIEQWKEQRDKSIRVVAFGSSNTELGWAHAGRHTWADWLFINFRAHIGRHMQVINQGIGGERSDQLLTRIARDVLSFDPSVVIVTVGGNDSIQRLPLQQFTDNLRRVCEIIQSHGAIPVLQTYYCPMYHLGREGFRDEFESFMEVNRQLSREMDVPLADQYRFFEPMYNRHPEAYARMTRDWIHLNHLGNFFMAQHLSRLFGLPDLPVPADMKQDVEQLSGLMYAEQEQA
ncbi:MAG: hydrolase family protein [Paenibacillus sp.]|jgi:lysophospholipase L1-like esterase|nr:hydrolase family protein [Paenibacillus sp.]